MTPNAPRRGASNPNARLTQADVDAMRILRRSHRWSFAEIAKAFQVSKSQAVRVCNHKNWRD
jgi:hypothetical protein